MKAKPYDANIEAERNSALDLDRHQAASVLQESGRDTPGVMT